MKLESVPVGFQDVYTGIADEDFENPIIVPRSGDATQLVKKTGKNTLELTVQGNGTVGSNTSFAVQVDGHIGEGEVEVINEFDYDVVSPDATLVNFQKTRREPIPQAA